MYSTLASLVFTLLLRCSHADLLSFSTLEGSANLCSPRKLTVYNNSLFIAEAGTGAANVDMSNASNATCYGSDSSPTCLGTTSSVRSIDLGQMEETDVLVGLFSARPISGRAESQATGIHHTAFDDNGVMFTVIGLGGLNGTLLSEAGVENSIGDFGSILQGSESDYDVWASPWYFEYQYDYDLPENSTLSPDPDSNPYHLLILGDLFYVADAGCNCIMVFQRDADGLASCTDPQVLVLPKLTGIDAVTTGPCTNVSPPFGPSFCGEYQDENGAWKYDYEFVPTAVRSRPGHPDKIYVSALGGAIWSEPKALIMEYELDGNGYPKHESGKAVAGGPFWAIADFEFEGEDELYVLETNPGGFVPFGGRLSLVTLSTSATVILAESSLERPTGMVIHDGMMYITNNTFNPGSEGGCGGHVISSPLPVINSGVKCPRRRNR